MADRTDAERLLADASVSTVRLYGTNHDGLILGKHLSVPKFLATLDGGGVLADTCFGVDLSGGVAMGWDWGEWRGQVSDIKLVPDASTLTVDPAYQGLASAIGDFCGLDDRPLPVCYRGLLKRMVARLDALGFQASVAPELEFSVFEQSLHEARERGYRDLTPLGGDLRITYLMTRSQDSDTFARAAADRLGALGVGWESWSTETAGGQLEINLGPADPLTTADGVTRTKLALREVAAEQERTVTFMAKIDEHLGAGMHLNVSAHREGANAFWDPAREGNRSETLENWLGGILATLPGAMSFLSPNPNSYRRLVDITGPPTTVTWGPGNKSTALRTVTREPGSSRIEHRVPAGDCNVYLAIATTLAGAIAGLEERLEPPPPYDGMAWALPDGTAQKLPSTLPSAAEALRADARLGEVLGRDVVDYWLGSREWEWMAFNTGGGDPDEIGEFELKRYFEQV